MEHGTYRDSPPVTVVSGGGTGIGRATACRLARAGHHVLICGRRAEPLEATTKDLRAEGYSCIDIQADVSDEEQAAAVIRAALDAHGALTGVVSAHGGANVPKPVEEVDASEWLYVLRSDLLGVVNLIRPAVTPLKQSRGAIVAISSISSIRGEPVITAYAAAKAGVNALVQNVAAELGPHGVRINAIAPGWVMTDLVQHKMEAIGVQNGAISTNMLGRVAEPDEIAAVAEFLLGPGASFITSETIVADGGHASRLVPLRVEPI